MFELISRLREPLSSEGRTGFSHVMYLSCIVGLVRGFSLISFIPAAIALTSGQPAWGMGLRGWLIALAVCAVASFILEYFLAIRSYVVAFDFLTNMHRAIGDKIASLPLGAFRADTAGRTSRLVSRELMMLGEIFAPNCRDRHFTDDACRNHRLFSAPGSGVPCLRPDRCWGSVGCAPLPAFRVSVERRSRPRIVSPHCRICDETGSLARLWALRLL